MKAWIGVDLDRTLAIYNGWKGPEHIGEPVPLMAARVKRWTEEGIKVKIFTARVSGEKAEAEQARYYIERWLKKNGFGGLEITCTKDYAMSELWDDRAVHVEANTGIAVGYTN